MRDRDFLLWLRDRLVHVYKENANVDFIHKLTGIAYTIDPNKDSPWVDPFIKRSDGSEEHLKELSKGERI